MPAGLFSTRVNDAVGLSRSDRDRLRSLRVTERTLDHREPLSREGEIATQCAIVHDGFLASYKIASDREQIIAFHVPGDFPDLQAVYAPVLDRGIISIGPARVGLISHSELKRVISASPNLAGIFWRETIIETTILREWICNIAARDALASISHLICELASRLDAVGLVKDDSFHLPLTQQDLANASGFSVVHVNRTLQELRRRRLLSWESRTVTLMDFAELKRIAEFEPAYLQSRPL
ncbi:CRP-like cAMP-binding protein [Bradyrhizobium sp. LB14.3]|uniref:Crp/Fnr family transcriptional regulator n=1 Tax=Bradyrhizobium sp. LB14.3 TaxID=3156328 RepID=UPI0033925885